MSTSDFLIEIPPAVSLTINERVALLTPAVARKNDASDRMLLAQLLLTLVRDEEAIELLAGLDAPELAYRKFLALGRAHAGLSRHAAAHEAFASAVRQATTPRELSIARSEQAQALDDMGDAEASASLQTNALRDDPDTPYAFVRLANLDLRQGRAGMMLDRTDAWLDAGRSRADVLGSRYTALLATGDTEAAEALAGLDPLVVCGELPVPDGWDSLDAFNADLMRELQGHSGRRQPRSARGVGGRWRLDDLRLERLRAAPALLEALRRQALIRAAAHVSPDHLWSAVRPDQTFLRSWCTLTREGGFDDWHMHPPAWMSGVYYVNVPAGGEEGDRGGSIELGAPERSYLATAKPGRRRLVRPHAGMLLTFPSHVFHRTWPTEGPVERISIAFDLGYLGEAHVRF